MRTSVIEDWLNVGTCLQTGTFQSTLSTVADQIFLHPQGQELWNMKRLSWQGVLVLSLVVISIVIYLVHYAIFRDARNIFFYMVMEIAFLPIQVLLVTLIIHRLLEEREKRARLEKLNMVIGTFFSEVGTQLLTYLSDFDPNLEKIRSDLIVTNNWSEQEFMTVSRHLRNHSYGVDIKKIDLENLKTFLSIKKDFLVRLLESPTLLEHQSFTEHLRAVFHLAEELSFREDIKHLPETDISHLANDIKRAYQLIVYQWLDYMRYLKKYYPYLFSFAMRTNPFDENASPIVK